MMRSRKSQLWPALALSMLLWGGPAFGQSAERITPGSIETPKADSLTRDPFKQFKVERPTGNRPRTPLEQRELLALTLVAVIQGGTDSKAMVEDGQGLGFTVTVGTPIGKNDGVVTEIHPDRIVVEETFYDYLDEAKQRTVELELEGEGERSP